MSCDLQGFGGDDIVGWQLADLDASTMLGRGQATELGLRALGIDGLLQAVQLAAESTDPRVVALEQAHLEPAVVVLVPILKLTDRALCWLIVNCPYCILLTFHDEAFSPIQSSNQDEM